MANVCIWPNDSGLFRTAAQLREAGFVRDGGDWVPPEGCARDKARSNIAGGAIAEPAVQRRHRCAATERYVPLYEAKMIHQFDHRWATYDRRRTAATTIAGREGRSRLRANPALLGARGARLPTDLLQKAGRAAG